MKINEMAKFYVIFARKIIKMLNFYDICPKKLTKFRNFTRYLPENSQILHDNCPKIFPEFWGHVPLCHLPPSHSIKQCGLLPMASAVSSASPVTILRCAPVLSNVNTASWIPSRGGSRSPTIPTNVRFSIL